MLNRSFVHAACLLLITAGIPVPVLAQNYSNIPPNQNVYPAFSNMPAAGATAVDLKRQAAEITNRAYDFSQAGNNEQAIALLRQAEEMDPASPTVHLDLSAAYIALKRYNEALPETAIVLQMNPDDEKGYLNYLAAAIGANRMQDALLVGQEYLQRFPKGQNRKTLSNEMVAVEHELDRRANARGVMPPPGSPDNYLFYATPNGRRRWPPTAMPLKVFINHGNNCKGFVPEFETALINSFLTWQNATRGVLRFVPVDNPRVADIECAWTDSTKKLSLAAEGGEARIETCGAAIYHVTITLLTRIPDEPSDRLTVSLLQGISLHEIGHALGLDGHSDNAQDIMYCSTNPNVEHPQLTQRDINTLYLLYD